MRFCGEDDELENPVNIGSYCEECFKIEGIPTNRKDVEIHYVYKNDKKDYCHILLNWGEKNVYLVIVTKPVEQKIHGHYLLDLNKEYGLYEEGHTKG